MATSLLRRTGSRIQEQANKASAGIRKAVNARTTTRGASGGRPAGALDSPQSARQTGTPAPSERIRRGSYDARRAEMEERIRQSQARADRTFNQQPEPRPKPQRPSNWRGPSPGANDMGGSRNPIMNDARPGALRRGLSVVGKGIRSTPSSLLFAPAGRAIGEGLGRLDSAVPFAGNIRDGSTPDEAPVSLRRLTEGTMLGDAGNWIGETAGRLTHGAIPETETTQRTEAPQQTAALNELPSVRDPGTPLTEEEIEQAMQTGTLMTSLDTSDPERTMETTTAVDSQGGTGTLTAQQGIREGVRRRLTGQEQGGTLSVVSGDGLDARARADNQVAFNEAAQRAMDAGDHATARELLASPEERAAIRENRATDRLRRQATETQGLDQSISSLFQERLRRGSARRELASRSAGQEAAATAAQSQADRDSRERIALMNEQGRNARAEGTAERQAAADAEAAFHERIDRDFKIGTEREDLVGRGLMEAFAQRAGVDQMDSENYRQAKDFVELASTLDREAEDASEKSVAWRGLMGALALTGAGVALRQPGLLRRGAGAGVAAVAGTEAATSGGRQMPRAESAEELFGFIDVMREAGVGQTSIRGLPTIQYRGEEIRLQDMTAQERQRLERLVELAPGQQE